MGKSTINGHFQWLFVCLPEGSPSVQAGQAVNEVNEDPDAEKPLLRGPDSDWTIKAWTLARHFLG